jgi:hypothetical protein
MFYLGKFINNFVEYLEKNHKELNNDEKIMMIEKCKKLNWKQYYRAKEHCGLCFGYSSLAFKISEVLNIHSIKIKKSKYNHFVYPIVWEILYNDENTSKEIVNNMINLHNNELEFEKDIINYYENNDDNSSNFINLLQQ